jgi:AmiR/NasT family two-component response regulator
VDSSTHDLRVLVANHRKDRIELIASVVADLGHEVVAREIHVSEVAAVTSRERPDVALVGLGDGPDHALELISEIARGMFCPVIALLDTYDAEWIDAAAQRGIYAYIVDSRPEELQSAIDITLRRFAQFHELQGAFERRDAEGRREAELLAQRRQLLELHDGLVQSITVARLALELDRIDESRETLLEALENTHAFISRSLDSLRREGVPLHN